MVVFKNPFGVDFLTGDGQILRSASLHSNFIGTPGTLRIETFLVDKISSIKPAKPPPSPAPLSTMQSSVLSLLSSPM